MSSAHRVASPTQSPSDAAARARDVTVLDLLDRILDRGVVLTGSLTISVADVDLIALELRILLGSVERLQQFGAGDGYRIGELADG